MGWLSILPEDFNAIESWLARTFILLALITIFPWIAMLLYDAILYTCRLALYEMPVVGGRARGQQRPRAPSLTERTDGNPRRFSFALSAGSATEPLPDTIASSPASTITSRKHGERDRDVPD